MCVNLENGGCVCVTDCWASVCAGVLQHCLLKVYQPASGDKNASTTVREALFHRVKATHHP